MLRVLLSSVALLLFTSAEAQQYPSRPIRFVMAYPPGGSSDALARPIANEMTKGLGQPVLLEYKPGGGSTIGADFWVGMLVNRPSRTVNFRFAPGSV